MPDQPTPLAILLSGNPGETYEKRGTKYVSNIGTEFEVSALEEFLQECIDDGVNFVLVFGAHDYQNDTIH